MDVTRVVLADDHPGLRARFRSILERDPEIEVVGEVENGMQAIRMVDALQPDVLILDVEMPVMDGLAATRQLRASNLPVHILIVSGHDDRHYIQGVLANGASGYITKDEAPEMIVEAVHGVARGEENWLSQQASDRLSRLAKKYR